MDLQQLLNFMNLDEGYIPPCPTCHQSDRYQVGIEDVSPGPRQYEIRQAWKQMPNPEQVVYCPNCKEYSILGGWEEF